MVSTRKLYVNDDIHLSSLLGKSRTRELDRSMGLWKLSLLRSSLTFSFGLDHKIITL